ncbi:hypothetical protein V2H45_21070 [Tumidithrix elongata RA019]|uniref:Uncharacterized protein n=1 Tax=Tumidithrix elongata BACA0141 TaxID=2716417 RepID=A0AAW9PW90_9CYAN|nr:hypothetical protein [Tumidithrix elongata RA019]
MLKKQEVIAVNPNQPMGQIGNLTDLMRSLQTPTGVSLLVILLFGAIGASIFGYFKFRHVDEQRKLEKLKNSELVRKLKFALHTLSEQERNPDLIHSREFNLDYLSMRMDEEEFRDTIMAQIKLYLRQRVVPIIMPLKHKERDRVGSRKVDVTFDVHYMPDHHDNSQARVLFRIQIKLAKLPTQSAQSSINDIAIALENFMIATESTRNWQPTIQGKLALISWDQKAKPTPLLVIEQTNEGSNVSFRTRKIFAKR